MQRLQRRFRRGRHDLQQSCCRAGGATAALFPVLQGAHVDPHQVGELDLRKVQVFADGLHVLLFDREAAGRRGLAPGDAAGLLDAADKFFKYRTLSKKFLIHVPTP